MPGLFEELDEWEREHQDDSQDAELEAAPKPEGVLGTDVPLEELASRPGRFQELAAELVAIREEREAKAEQERLALAAEAAIDSGLDLDTPEAQAQLVALAQKQRADEQAFWHRQLLAELVKEHGEEGAQSKMAEEERAMAQVEAFLGDPSPWDVADYRAFRRAQVEKVKAEQVAMDMQRRIDPAYEQDLAAAETEIGAVVNQVLSR